MRTLAILFAAAAWLFLAGVIYQVFLAGIGAFKLAPWTAHAEFGWGLASAPLLILPLAIAARPERRTVWLTVALAVAAAIQPELAYARHTDPVLAALHPVNALLVFWLAWLVARRSLRHLREVASRAVEHRPVEPQAAERPATFLAEPPAASDKA